MRYEDLTTDSGGVTRGVVEFLGLRFPDSLELVPRTRRQVDQLNFDWITRCRAMAGDSEPLVH